MSCVGKSPASAVNKKQEKHLHFQRKQAASSKVGSLKVEGIGPQLLSQSKLQVFPRRSINSWDRDFFAFFRMPKTPSVCFVVGCLTQKQVDQGGLLGAKKGARHRLISKFTTSKVGFWVSSLFKEKVSERLSLQTSLLQMFHGKANYETHDDIFYI